MTRKRFIKLLMADGYDRNHANDIATDVNKGFSYDQLYCIHCAMPQISDICGQLKPAIAASVERIIELIPPFVETLAQTITEIFHVAVEAGKKMKALAEELEANNE